jgi:hypothetical protein
MTAMHAKTCVQSRRSQPSDVIRKTSVGIEAAWVVQHPPMRPSAVERLQTHRCLWTAKGNAVRSNAEHGTDVRSPHLEALEQLGRSKPQLLVIELRGASSCAPNKVCDAKPEFREALLIYGGESGRDETYRS